MGYASVVIEKSIRPNSGFVTAILFL